MKNGYPRIVYECIFSKYYIPQRFYILLVCIYIYIYVGIIYSQLSNFELLKKSYKKFDLGDERNAFK